MNYDEILDELNRFYNIYLNETDLEVRELLITIIKNLTKKLNDEATSDLTSLN